MYVLGRKRWKQKFQFLNWKYQTREIQKFLLQAVMSEQAYKLIDAEIMLRANDLWNRRNDLIDI